MKDLSALQATTKAIADAQAIIDANIPVRNKLIAAGRKDGYAWPSLEAASGLSRQGTVNAGVQGNRGVLPVPRQRAA